jgi:hypothetical protein
MTIDLVLLGSIGAAGWIAGSDALWLVVAAASVLYCCAGSLFLGASPSLWLLTRTRPVSRPRPRRRSTDPGFMAPRLTVRRFKPRRRRPSA